MNNLLTFAEVLYKPKIFGIMYITKEGGGRHGYFSLTKIGEI